MIIGLSHLFAIIAIVAVVYATRARIKVRLWHMFVITTIVAVALVNRTEIHYRATLLYFDMWPDFDNQQDRAIFVMLAAYKSDKSFVDAHPRREDIEEEQTYLNTNMLVNDIYRELPDYWLPRELRQFRTQEWKDRLNDAEK